MDIESVNSVFKYDMQERSEIPPKSSTCWTFGKKGLGITFVAEETDEKIWNEVQECFDVNITELPDEIDLSKYIEGR